MQRDTELDTDEDKPGCKCNVAPYLLMMALSVHSIFEGMAVGLAQELDEALFLMIAIWAHKGVAGLSLGIALIKTFPEDFRLIRTLVLMFALATPVGVVLGMIIASNDLVCLVFNSIAAGTFVYIGCSEVTVNEFSVPAYRWWKLLAFCVGAVFILSLYWIEN